MTRLPAPFFVLVVYISGSMLAGEPVSCAQQNTSGVADSSSLASPQGVAAEGGYQELPPPGTTAAQALVADPRTSGELRYSMLLLLQPVTAVLWLLLLLLLLLLWQSGQNGVKL